MGGDPMAPPVSLSLLPRTMRREADLVTHCQARRIELWGGFFPSAYRTFVNGWVTTVAAFHGLWLFFAAARWSR